MLSGSTSRRPAREPGGFVPRSRRVPGAAGGAGGGHLLPPPVRRAMPSGEGPRASPGAAVRGWGGTWGTTSSLRARDCHLLEILVLVSTPARAARISAVLGAGCWPVSLHFLLSPPCNGLTPFHSLFFLGILASQTPQPKNDQYQQLGGTRPAGELEVSWLLPSAEQRWGAGAGLLSLFPLAAVHSSSQLHWPSQ